MAMTVSCPSCNKALRIGEENQGKKMRCPSCQQIFKAPMLSEEQQEPADQHAPDDHDNAPPRPRNLELDDDRPSRRRDEDDRPVRRDDYDRPSRRRDEYDDDRPRRRDDDRPRRREDFDDDDRPRRRRDEDDYDFRRPPPSGSNPSNVLAILSCVLCIFPVIGFVLGLIAFIQANSAMNQLPPGSEYSQQRGSLQSSKTIAIVGMCLSGGMVLCCCGINILGNMH